MVSVVAKQRAAFLILFIEEQC